MKKTKKLIEALLYLDLGNRLGTIVLLLWQVNCETDYQARHSLLNLAHQLIRAEKDDNLKNEHHALVAEERKEASLESGRSPHSVRPEKERKSGVLQQPSLEKVAAGISRIASALQGVLEDRELRASHSSGSHSKD